MTGRRWTFLLLLLSCAASAADDGEEWERPYLGVLPEPEENVSVNPPERGVATPLPRAATYVVDASTGKPLAGATLTLFPEDVGMGVASYARGIAKGMAEENGLAGVDAAALTGAGHWIAEAPGYAPRHEYGARPPSRMPLARGADLRGRVLDPTGRPVVGATVDAYLGCEHSGTVRVARTGKDGVFVLPSMPPDETQCWIAFPSGCLGFAEGLGRLGRRTADVVLDAAASARGRFVDAAGKPVAGVVVRAIDFDRAPIAVSGADGRFELVGFPSGRGLHGHVPGAASDFVVDREEVGPLPRTITLDAAGQPVAPEDDAKIVLNVATAEGTYVSRERVRLTRVSDGSTFEVRTMDDDDESPGSVSADVPSGTYDVAPASPFGPATFPPFRWEIAKGATAERTVVATAQPTLLLRGRIPPGARVVLAAAGCDWARKGTFEGWRPHLPADGPAVVSVQPRVEQRAVFFFPVGEAQDGERVADIDLPRPHAVRVAGTPKLVVERLTCDGFDVAHDVRGATLTTYAEGPMVLDARTADGVRRVAFEIPAGATEGIAVDLAGAAPVASQRMVRVSAESKWARVRVESEGSTIAGGTSAEAPPPCRVIVTRIGHQPFDRTFTEPAEVRPRWGPCSLRLVVRDASGAPAPSVVQVDDVVHWTDEGVLELAGLAEGPHAILVAPVRAELAGRELRLVLRDGESRTRDVVVPKR